MNEPTRPRFRKWASRALDALLLLAALAALGLIVRQQDSGPPTGITARPFDLPLVGEGGRFAFTGAAQRPLLVEAFASWCTACQRSGPIVEGLRDATLAGKLDIVLVSVDDDERAALGAKRTWPIGLPVAFDEKGAFQRAYQIKVLPTYVLIAPDGHILDVSSGPPGGSTIRKWLHAGEP